LIAPDLDDITNQLAAIERFLASSLTGIIEDCRSRVAYEEMRLRRAVPDVRQLRLRVDEIARRLQSQATSGLLLRRERLRALSGQLEALSPAATLQRGFSVVESLATHLVINDASALMAGDEIGIHFARGGAEGRVEVVFAER
jgi:exodeoxyribonuclease VII large subunit